MLQGPRPRSRGWHVISAVPTSKFLKGGCYDRMIHGPKARRLVVRSRVHATPARPTRRGFVKRRKMLRRAFSFLFFLLSSFLFFFRLVKESLSVVVTSCCVSRGCHGVEETVSGQSQFDKQRSASSPTVSSCVCSDEFLGSPERTVRFS